MCVFMTTFIFRMAVFTTGLVLVFFLIPYYILGQGSESSTGGKTEDGVEDILIVRLFLNLMGYATIFVPGAILIRYLRQAKYNETASEYLKCVVFFIIYYFYH